MAAAAKASAAFPKTGAPGPVKEGAFHVDGTNYEDSAHQGTRHTPLPVKGDDANKAVLAHETTHMLCQDSGWEAGFHLATAVDNAFILGYALLVFGFLGWAPGVVLFFLGGCMALYCNIKLAQLCIIDGKRYTRFRDISYKVYGSFGYWVTVVGQWLNIIFGNVGLTILGGQALKGAHDLWNSNQNIKLADWMIVVGAVSGIFSLAIPHLHNLRLWSAIACACTIVFVLIVIGISAHDGGHYEEWANNVNADPETEFPVSIPRSYTVDSLGDRPTVAFDALGALATIAFAFTTVITPEIQATVRDPPVTEFYKTLAVTYGIGAPVFLIMTIVGYWAYGNGVDSNLISNLSGPDWAKTLAYIGVVVQCIVSIQVYASPIYETVDTKFGDAKVWTMKNFWLRLVYRTFYIAFTTFLAALLPFFGDFVALMGALTVFPIAFVLVLMMHVKVFGGPLWQKILDWSLAALFACLTVACTASALRYIIVDSTNYSVFANISG